MKKVLSLMSLLLALVMFYACSSSDAVELTTFNPSSYRGEQFGTEDVVLNLGDMNVLTIQAEDGSTETCWGVDPYCGRLRWGVTECFPNDSTCEVYPMVFTTEIKYSKDFNVLQIEYHNYDPISVVDLQIGDTIGYDAIRVKAWTEESFERVIRYQNLPRALGGTITVTDKKAVEDGVSSITLNLQDLQFETYDQNWEKRYYTLNGTMNFEISEGGTYPDDGFDLESLLRPSPNLYFFFMDALHSSENQGRRTFFSGSSEEQECLIINSEEEFREAYKGDKELPVGEVNFDYCTLVMGRTFGEHGGISLADYELTDQGDSYEIALTLNNNTNPNCTFTAGAKDLYFWKIYPKMEKKSVVFSRKMEDINEDPLGPSSTWGKMCGHWTLADYIDSDGTYHKVGTSWGDDRYSFDLMEDGSVSGQINGTADFSFKVMVPYAAPRVGYNDGVDHGIFSISDWQVSEVNDNNPVSKRFMDIVNVTQFQMFAKEGFVADWLCLYITPNEYIGFIRSHEE